MIKVLVLKHDDDTAHLQEVEGSLADFQKIVGGLIEAFPVGRFGNMYLNDEGKLLGLPYNHNAQALLAEVGQRMLPGDFIVGDVVLTGDPDSEGNDTSVSPVLLNLVQGMGIPIDGR